MRWSTRQSEKDQWVLGSKAKFCDRGRHGAKQWIYCTKTRDGRPETTVSVYPSLGFYGSGAELRMEFESHDFNIGDGRAKNDTNYVLRLDYFTSWRRKELGTAVYKCVGIVCTPGRLEASTPSSTNSLTSVFTTEEIPVKFLGGSRPETAQLIVKFDQPYDENAVRKSLANESLRIPPPLFKILYVRIAQIAFA